MGIHALDMFINLFGRVTDVHVQSKRVASPIDVDDSTLIRMNFENGCTGHLTTLSATNMLWRISVFCLGGWVEIRDQDKLEVTSLKTGPRHRYTQATSIRPWQLSGPLWRVLVPILRVGLPFRSSRKKSNTPRRYSRESFNLPTLERLYRLANRLI